MKQEKKTNNKTGIFFTCTEAQKKQIKRIAKVCGMRQGEYILKRALGYEPKAVLPDVFFQFHDKLCKVLEMPLTPETEKAALRIFDEIYAQLIDSKKQTTAEISLEMKAGDASWQQSDSGLSKAG